MPDVFDKAKRSEVMSRIRGHGNKDTEIALMRLLRINRINCWRRRQPVFGRPDFVFPKLKVAVFVDGCFWHCCPRHSNLPVNNRPFWQRKLHNNKLRDLRVNRELRTQGWLVLRIWEHDLTRRNERRVLKRIRAVLEMATAKERRALGPGSLGMR